MSADARKLESIRRAVLVELRRRPRARPWWHDALALSALNLTFALVPATVVSWSTGQHASHLVRLANAAMLSVLLVAGAVSAIRPRAAARRGTMEGLAVVAAIGVALGGSGAGSDVPFSNGLSCALIVVGLGAGPAVVAARLLSSFAFSWSRAVLGAMAAAAPGVLTLHFHCPIGTLAHLGVFHVAPWLAVAAATVVLRWYLPSRSFAP